MSKEEDRQRQRITVEDRPQQTLPLKQRPQANSEFEGIRLVDLHQIVQKNVKYQHYHTRIDGRHTGAHGLMIILCIAFIPGRFNKHLAVSTGASFLRGTILCLGVFITQHFRASFEGFIDQLSFETFVSCFFSFLAQHHHALEGVDFKLRMKRV